MPTRRLLHTADMVFHVMNRAVRKAPLFTLPGDYETFFDVVQRAPKRLKMRTIAITAMPNHWHMVLWPRRDGDLAEYVGWISLTHACIWHRVHETRGTGPVYQGRYKAIPVQPGQHLLTVVRYVERNAVEAKLVERAELWPWTSASTLASTLLPPICQGPTPRPANWLDLVNEADSDAARKAVRESLLRGVPYGDPDWSKALV